jgi:hypothetical protein
MLTPFSIPSERSGLWVTDRTVSSPGNAYRPNAGVFPLQADASIGRPAAVGPPTVSAAFDAHYVELVVDVDRDRRAVLLGHVHLVGACPSASDAPCRVGPAWLALALEPRSDVVVVAAGEPVEPDQLAALAMP